MPFVYMGINNKKKKNQLVQKLKELAQANNCTITQYDIVNSLAIGIDEASAVVFFIKKAVNTQISQLVHLADIQKCNLVTTNKTVAEEGYNFKTLDKLELVFNPRNRNDTQTVITFYEAYSADSSTLSDEIAVAEKWCNMSNKIIETLSSEK